MKVNDSIYLHKASTPLYSAPNVQAKIIIRFPETSPSSNGTSQSLPSKGNYYSDFQHQRLVTPVFKLLKKM